MMLQLSSVGFMFWVGLVDGRNLGKDCWRRSERIIAFVWVMTACGSVLNR